jgi:ATP-dependent protease ClpP protease subunit
MASRAKKKTMRNRFQAGSPVVSFRAAQGETEILVYGDIGESFWDDSGITAKGIKAQLDAASANDVIVVRINSPGGDAFEGVAICNILRDDSRRIVVKVDGTAISSASIVAMAGDEIRMADNALMMIHNPWTCVCGDSTEMRLMADRLDKVGAALAQTYVSRTGKSRDDIAAMMAAETWFSAEEAFEAGFATHIDGARDDAEALLTEQRIAAYGNVPGSAARWVRGNNALAIQYTASAACTTGDLAYQNSPPADTERGGTHPQTETAMDLPEVQAALTDATAMVARLTEDVSAANARGDMLEAQNIKLVEERDAIKAELDTIDATRLVDKVRALVGVKFAGNEYDDQLESAKLNEALFDRLMVQRSDMSVLVRDPAGIGDDKPTRRAGANDKGQGLADIVRAATAAQE